MTNVGFVSLVIVIFGISAVGLYFGYSLNHSLANANSISLQSFSLNPSTPSLSGNVRITSNSPLSRMSLYLNGTYVGEYNYSYMRSMMSAIMGSSYPYAYSMMYSASRSTMPMFANFPTMQNRIYNVTMIATFADGSTCRGNVVIHS